MVKFYKIIVVAYLKMDTLFLYISFFVVILLIMLMMFKMLIVQVIH